MGKYQAYFVSALFLLFSLNSCSKKSDGNSNDKFYGNWYGTKGCTYCDTISFISPNVFKSVNLAYTNFDVLSTDTITFSTGNYSVRHGYRFDSSGNLTISNYECQLITNICHDVTFKKY